MLEKTPTVTVIIPTYNHAHFLPQAVQSVLEQTFADFEIIVVDDGSTDNTREAAQTFTDPRFRYIYQSNKGLAASRNIGLAAAQGEFVAFLDSDDLFLPHKLAVQVEWLRRHEEVGMVVSGYYYMDEQATPLKAQPSWLRMPTLTIRDWLFDCPIVPHSLLVRKEWVDRVGGFDDRLRRVEDWDLWIRLAYAGCKMAWVEEIVGGYRLFPGQMTRNAADQKRVSVFVMDEFFSQSDLPPELQALKPAVYTHMYLVSAGREYGAGQWEDAKESVSAAIKLTPELLRGRQLELLNTLLSWANNPFVGDPLDYTTAVFNNLPDEALFLRRKKRWGLGEIGLRMLFTAYQGQRWPLVRRAGKTVALNAPSRLLNRGVLSILWQSIKQ